MFIERVIRSLEKHRVRYVVVGGCAVAFHGAVRGTVDVDVAIPFTKSAFARTEKALQEIGLQSRLPVTAQEVFAFREDYMRNRNLKAWTFTNPANPLEIVDVVMTTDARELKTVTKRTTDFTIRIVAIPDLIAMKKMSGRPQDIEDVRALRRLA